MDEREVLSYSATGLGAAEVANRLGCSRDLAQQHLASAIEKLGARSKLEAVVLALRLGLIPIPLERA